MYLSVVIPLYNEEENISELVLRIKNTLNTLRKTYEVVFIDDGSSDKTYEKLLQAKKNFKEIKIIKMRKRFGQTNALSYGFKESKGSIIITMDGDLQNDPADIPKMIEMIEKGYDVVSGWRKDRKDPIGKKLFSKISNYMARKLTGLNIHDSGCSLKAYRRETLDGIELYGEMHRYIPAIIAMDGFKVGETVVKHNERKHGKTKYGWGRLTKGFLDLVYIKFLSDYSTRPLHLFGRAGLLLFGTGALIALYKILQLALFGIPLTVGPLLLLSVLFVITSAQFLIFGVMSDIELRIYHSRKNNGRRVENISE